MEDFSKTQALPLLRSASIADWTISVQVPTHATRQELDAYILKIRQQSNALVPIARLPPEILSRIFYECVRLPSSGSSEPLWRLWWIKVTHVCHHWRAVFLSTPTLWGEVRLSRKSSGPPVEEWLTRSRDTQVNIVVADAYFPLPSQEFQRLILAPLLDVWPRVRHLELYLPRRMMRLFVWPRSATRLERLAILDVSRIIPALEDKSDIDEELLQTLDDRFPRLKELIIQHYPFDFKTWSLPASLTKLDVSNQMFPRDGSVTVTETVQALRHLTSLKHLSLVQVLPDSDPADWATMEPIYLPLLETLRLEGSAHAHVWLLHILELPSTIDLTLLLILDNRYPDITMLSPLSASLERLGPLRSAVIFVEGGAGSWHDRQEKFTFQAWRLVEDVQDMAEVAGFSFADVNISFISEDERPTDGWIGLRPLLETFPLSCIETLCITCDQGAFFFAPQVYGKMNQVHTLSLVGGGEFHTSGSLVVDLLHVSEHEDNTIFPKLRVIRAKDADFRMVTERFQTVLRRYRDKYRPLKVVLRTCYNLDEKAVNDLKQCAEVDWDGVELEATESSEDEEDEDDEDDGGWYGHGYDPWAWDDHLYMF